jgi:ribonuclease P protein component
VSRKVGIAVTRNRVKRRLREWFRTSSLELPRGHDLIVIARPGAATQSPPEARRELKAGVARLKRAVERRGTR